MTYLFIFLPVLVWLVFAKFILEWRLSWLEICVQTVVSGILALILVLSSSSYQTHDLMLVNGEVTDKEAIRKTCKSHWSSSKDSFCEWHKRRSVRVYPDTCTGTGKNRSCSANYRTEYKPIFDFEIRYFVESTLKTYEIEREDKQGLITPARFAEVNLGDLVTMEQSYVNYIKGASESLFSEGEPEGTLPLAYPRVKDYYKAKRVIVYGVPFSAEQMEDFNNKLEVLNKALIEKNVNVIVVFTTQDESFATKLARSWDSHNLNDLVITIGTKDAKTIEWVDVRSWSKNDLVDISIRDYLLDFEDRSISMLATTIAAYNYVNDYYEEPSMDDFEYLAEDIPLPTFFYVLAFLFLVIFTPSVSFFFHNRDL